jgi:multiple sugar transport system substrate-binding protein
VRRTSRYVALLLLAVCALVVAACGSSDDDKGATTASGGGSGDKVKISFLTHWAPETVRSFERVTAAFEARHPDVDVEIRAVPFADLLTTLRSQAGGDNGPTMASIYDLWLPELVRDGVLSRAPAANAAEVRREWPANLAAAASVGGDTYGYPNEVDLYALNYNKALFRAAGISAPPRTWDELIADAKRLTKKDGDRITQQGFGLISSWAAGTVHPFTSLLYSNGGELIVDGRAALDSPQAGETFDLVDQLANKEKVASAQMSTADANTTGPYLENFVSGKTAMIIMANWWESALKSGMKDNYKDIATAPVPVGPSGDASHSISYSWMTVVNAKAEPAAQKAAWDFLAWLNGPTSGPHGASAMGDILVSMGILPSRSSDVAAFKDQLNSPFLAGYVAGLPDARPYPVVLGGQEFTEALQQHIEAIEFGKESAADAQKAAQADATSILARAAK